MTFPVGLGDKEWTTPVGKFRIGEKRVHPTWHIPPSLQYKYPVKAVPPGPDNPLGEYCEWPDIPNAEQCDIQRRRLLILGSIWFTVAFAVVSLTEVVSIYVFNLLFKRKGRSNSNN